MKRKIFLNFILATTLALSACTKAPEPPVETGTTQFSSMYTTEIEAVTEALRQSDQLSEKVEYAGAIFLYEGGYHYTLPQTSNSSVSFEGTIRYPEKGVILATYHTHPWQPHVQDTSMIFSEADVVFGVNNKVKMYIGVMKTNQIRVYIPGKTKTDNHSVMGLISYGEIVGNY